MANHEAEIINSLGVGVKVTKETVIMPVAKAIKRGVAEPLLTRGLTGERKAVRLVSRILWLMLNSDAEDDNKKKS